MAKKRAKHTKPSVQVDIVSDIVCPWCWLGSSYFQDAIRQSKQAVEAVWRPYMLDPMVPENGVPYAEYMAAKFGGGAKDRFRSMRDHLEAAAPEAGITFRFGDIAMRPNTLNAHRLIRWASGQGLGNAASEALFKAYFDELRDVGDADVLTDIAAEIGLDADLVAELLNTDKDKQSVEEEIEFFRRLGVSGVPCFIYGGQFAVQGAQPSETHLAAIEKAANLLAAQ